MLPLMLTANFAVSPRRALAQGAEPARRPDFVAHPRGPTLGQWSLGFGAAVDVLPRRLVESEVRQLPRVWGRSRLGLGREFYFSQRANVIVIDNQLQVGAGWGIAFGALSLGVHDHFGLTWGTLGVEGFDATGWAFAHNPGLSVSCPLRAVESTLSVEALVLHARHAAVGELSLTEKRMSFQGLSAALTFESVLSSLNVVFYGVAALYAKPDYQLWLAFSDAEQPILFPRFFGGYAF